MIKPALADDLLIRFASLDRAGVPGIIYSPNGDFIDTRAIRRDLYKVNFGFGDTLLWNIKTSRYRVYRDRTPSQVLSERFPGLDLAKNIAVVMPGQYWFSVGARVSDLDAKGTVVFAGKFNAHRLVSIPDNSGTSKGLERDGVLNGLGLVAPDDGPTAACSANPIPDITSALAVQGTKGTSFNYTITATNTPTSFNATGLPAGLTIDTGSGVISGTPTVDGVFNVGLNATNAGGADIEPMVLTLLIDSDGDGIPDIQDGTPSNPDTDGDGLPDGVDPDIDGDGVPNASDADAFDPDTDNDGIGDAFDENPLANNDCNGANVIFDEPEVFGPMTCAAASSITVSPMSQSLVKVLSDGDLRLIAPNVSFEPGFSVIGILTVISADPCPGCTP